MSFPLVKVIKFQQIDSTNTYAKNHLNEFDLASLTVIIANEQTAGRGQFARQWSSPPGGLYVSYVFFLDAYPANTAQLGQNACLAVMQTLELLGLHPTKKEPNDVLVDGKKIGGILCETVQHQNKIAVIIGIGINVANPDYILDQIDQPATSLLRCGITIPIDQLELHLRQQILRNY